MIRSLIKVVVSLAIALIIFSAVTDPDKYKLNVKKDIAPHVVPFRVLILNNKRLATGFHVSWKGKNYILTNRHVCDANYRTYRHNQIQFGEYIGTVLKVGFMHDLCLVTSDRKKGLEIAQEEAKSLDKVYLVGFPRGMAKTIREGHVIEIMSIFAGWLDDSVVKAIRVSTIAYGGNSGSPVVNTSGKVIGILFAGNQFHTEGYLVPLNSILDFMELYAN